MALKITAEIGTDKGITSEAYIRIVNYTIAKNGFATFKTELFLNENDAKTSVSWPFNDNKEVENEQIGKELTIEFTKEVEKDGIFIKVPDLTEAYKTNIFTFGYSLLKDKLIGLFGKENIVDC